MGYNFAIKKKGNAMQGELTLDKIDTTLTEEKLQELKKKVSESLSLDRQKIIVTRPFLGGMLMRFELVPVRSRFCDTACTDYQRIFFDIDFYKSLSENERIFVLAHEIWHVIYLHQLRKQSREHMLFNIASDCEINYMLKNDGFHPPENLCFPDKEVEGKNAEEIYEYLLKKLKNHQNSGGGSGKQMSGNGGKGGKGKLQGQFDKHVDPNGDENEGDGEQQGKNGLPRDEWGEKGDDPDYSPKIADDAAERVREMVISEAQRAERLEPGSVPGSVKAVIEKLQSAEIPWREFLSQFVTSSFGDRRQWLPPQRRSVWSETYLQSRRSEKINVVVAVDTSGSAETLLPKFMGELVSLLETFGRYEMRLIQCDAAVQSDEVYDETNPFPIDDPSSFKWSGFGGTSFCPVFKYIEENAYECTMLIYLTDGIGDAPKDPPPYPVLWILSKDGANYDFCKWGQKTRFKQD
jgi:predicted metal-dependent peptidase